MSVFDGPMRQNVFPTHELVTLPASVSKRYPARTPSRNRFVAALTHTVFEAGLTQLLFNRTADCYHVFDAQGFWLYTYSFTTVETPNFHMQVNDMDFIIHSIKLEDFNDIASQLPENMTTSTVVKLFGHIDDIRNTLRVFRGSPKEESFDASTWGSVLWATTEYDNPILKLRCIRSLERKNLAIGEYLPLFPDFGIPELKNKAVRSLVDRSTTITAQEIIILVPESAAKVMARWAQVMVQKIEDIPVKKPRRKQRNTLRESELDAFG
ncbi:hypothetical protein FRC12_004419 [Ceratobasidium sp. 428]|nr:hypothetical protein FRC12_004419 [Ceratobasidium sp. 428]